MYWSALNINHEPIADNDWSRWKHQPPQVRMRAASPVYTRQQIWRVTLPAVTLLNPYSSLRNPLFESAPGLGTGRGDDCWHPGGVKANPWWSLGKDPRAAPRRTGRAKEMEKNYLTHLQLSFLRLCLESNVCIDLWTLLKIRMSDTYTV